MKNKLLRSIFKKQLIQNNLFINKNLLLSFFKKQLIYTKQLITVSF